MSGPFHHNARRYTSGKSVDDEGSSSGVGSDQFPFLGDFVDSFITFICEKFEGALVLYDHVSAVFLSLRTERPDDESHSFFLCI